MPHRGDHRRGVWGGLLVSCTWLWLAACGGSADAEGSGVEAAPPTVCIADPNQHEVRPLGCRIDETSEDPEIDTIPRVDSCPAGTACRSNPRGERPACLANLGLGDATLAEDPVLADAVELGLGSGSACLFSDPGEINPRILRLGFQADFMSVDLDATGTRPTLSWARPAGADVVTCALFGCEPRVLADEIQPPIGLPRREPRIVNAASCMVDRYSSVSSFDTWTIDLAPGETADLEGVCGDAPQPLARWYDGLWVGCWAADTVQVVAASNLIELDAAELEAAFAGSLDCATAAAGDLCLMEDTGARGLCRQKECATPCVVDSDCDALDLGPSRDEGGTDTGDTGDTGGEKARWYCECCEGCGYVGTCVLGRPPP